MKEYQYLIGKIIVAVAIIVAAISPAGWGHPALRTNWEYRCRSGQFIRHGQLHAEHIAAHIADCADNAVLAVLLLHGGAVDAARWFQLRICITACPAPIGVLSVQWCLQEICCR